MAGDDDDDDNDDDDNDDDDGDGDDGDDAVGLSPPWGVVVGAKRMGAPSTPGRQAKMGLSVLSTQILSRHVTLCHVTSPRVTPRPEETPRGCRLCNVCMDG